MLYDTQAHKAKCLAKVAAAKLSEKREFDAQQTAEIAMNMAIALSPQSNQKDVLLAALEQDQQALKQHADVKQKIQLKKDVLIPKWLPFLEQYRDKGEHHPFAPLVWMVIWLLDAEYIDKCIYWADLAIKQQQKLPSNFTSKTLDTFVAEGLHDWAHRQLKAKHSAEPFLSYVVERIESRQWLVTEPIALSKIFKLVAQFAESEKNFEKAEQFYLKCVDANPVGHGVKTALGKVQTKLGKQLTLP